MQQLTRHVRLRVAERPWRRHSSATMPIRHECLRKRARCISSLSKEAATTPVDFKTSKRWLAMPPANVVHLSIGSVYVYSMWTPGMTTAIGVVGCAPMDWSHSQVLPVFSAAAVTFGITTSTLGSWVEKVGPRLSGFVGSLFWGSALCTTGLGVHLHSLPLVYLGYGILGGIGWGFMYLAPVTSAMKWFPDRRGLATGISLSAFGAGAAFAPGVIQACMEYFATSPEFIGPLPDMHSAIMSSDNVVELATLPDGSQVVAGSSRMGTPGQHVIVATDADVNRLSCASSGPGAYALGTGDNGTAKALGTLGVCYGILGALGSRFMIVSHPNWTPDGFESGKNESSKDNPHDIGLPVSYVMHSTTQFPLLCLAIFGNATGGLALISASKLMLTDIWAGVAPSIVTSSFTTGYVSALGVGMALGRFGWSAMSDYLGRRNTYALFGLSIPIVGFAPYLSHTAASILSSSPDDTSGVLPLLYTFYGGSVLAITFYGGIFSVLPAYIADLFGQKNAGTIHGKALSAWAVSAVAGPMGLAYMRSQSVHDATRDLIGKIEDTAAFEHAFGCSASDMYAVQTLVDAKTITIARLMELVPPDTMDPTPFLYDSTCYAAAGLMGVSALANLAIRPLDVPKIIKEIEKR